MIKSAADILADIEDTAPKPKRPKGRRRLTARLKVDPAARGMIPPAVVTEPRTQASPRDDAWHAEARAYRLAALEMGVHPLMPRDLYRRTS